jgi:hypothetical protein
MADRLEHSTKEILDYVHERTGGVGIGGKRLTDETITSAIWYIFRQDKDITYQQTRKGFYQMTSVEELMGDGPNSLRHTAAWILGDAKEAFIRQTALPDLPEQDQRALKPLRQAILSAIDETVNDIYMEAINQSFTDGSLNDSQDHGPRDMEMGGMG